jgi:hypothetical protein
VTEPDPAPLVARPFEGFAAPRAPADPVDVLRVLLVYGGGAVCGFVLLVATMTHRPTEGASASARLERARAVEAARVEAGQALAERVDRVGR